MPALDVLEGRCVQLRGGDREAVLVEGGDPALAVAQFAAEGAAFVHVVDLDGAFGGSPSADLVSRVVGAARGVPVQIGGGYRTVAAIERALAAGAARVLVGTAALEPGFLAEAASRFGERLVVAIDARDGLVAVDGWTRTGEIGAVELAQRCVEAGTERLLVTSIRRDGSLAGPDLDLLRAVRDASRLPVIASGGVASLDDLRAVRALGCEGAVVGSAIWLGRFSVAEALAALAA
jgi:phosphoribosylformimino-5-aminoimidazole carboxamide ribotide isomerase